MAALQRSVLPSRPCHHGPQNPVCMSMPFRPQLGLLPQLLAWIPGATRRTADDAPRSAIAVNRSQPKWCTNS